MSRTRAAAFDFLVCLIAVGAWAARVLPRLGTHLRDSYDSEFQAWGVAWVGHALLHSPRHLFDANIFAPLPNTLTFTEPLVGYGVLGIPLGLLGLSPAAVFNTLCLAGTAFSVWAISRLAVSHGASRTASLLGAFAAALGAAAATNLGYISFVALGLVAFSLLAWQRLFETGRWASAVMLAASLSLLAWFSLQLFAFGLAALAATIVADTIAHPGTRRLEVTFRLAASLGLAALLIARLAFHMLEARRDHGFKRDDAESRLYSASARDWLTTTNENPGQAFLKRRSDSERSLYPGTSALVLTAVGLAFFARDRRGEGLVAAGALLAALGMAGSLGPSGPVVPVLRLGLPFVFSGIRAFTRFGLVAEIGFALLAAAGAAALLERARTPAARGILAAGLGLAIAYDVRNTVRFETRPESAAPVDRFLAGPEAPGPILHLPLYHAPGDARWVFASLAHFKPVVNGYASYIPLQNRELANLLAEETIPDGMLARLRAWPVRTLVVHEHALPLDRISGTMAFLARALREGSLAAPYHFEHLGGDDWVFPLGDGASAAHAADRAMDSGRLFLQHADATPKIARFDESDFPASIDEPAEGEVVHGTLRVRGWSQTAAAGGTPPAPARIVEIRIDRDRRRPGSFARGPRPDVSAALPQLGGCAEAGYAATFPMLPGDDGSHGVTVVFQATDGRFRTLRRRFDWETGEASGSSPEYR